MRNLSMLLLGLLLSGKAVIGAEDKGLKAFTAARPRITQFAENKGQARDNSGKAINALYITELGSDAKAFFFNNSFSYVFAKGKLATQRIDVQFAGGNPNTNIEGFYPTNDVEHYYLPHCPNGINAHSFQTISYTNLYPGIVVLMKSAVPGNMEYDFVLQPGADLNAIQLKYKGASNITLNGQTLVIKTITGEIKEQIPSIYQLHQGVKTEVKGGYVLTKSGVDEWTVRFVVPSYDKAQTLVIDPWVTYLTSTTSGHDTAADNSSYISSLRLDSNGDIIVGGYTNSLDFPVTPGVAQENHSDTSGNYDAFIARFSSRGDRLWATYYGGSNDERTSTNNIAIDGSGNIAINLTTNSADFPVTAGASQGTSGGGGDGAIVKLTGSGMRVWATFCGGNADDMGRGLTIDGSDNIIAAIATRSQLLPVNSDAFQKNTWSQFYNSYLIKYTKDGVRIWSTYFGGSGNDLSGVLATDKDNNVILTGASGSADFPVTPGAFQTVHAGPVNLSNIGDVIIAKFDSSGKRLWATFYGGKSQEEGAGMAIDSLGNIYIAGSTYSKDFPTTAGALKTVGDTACDAFVLKFGPDGNRIWATLLGGTHMDVGGCIALGDGYIYLSGHTLSDTLANGSATNDFPVTSCAYQSDPGGGYDWWFAKMNAGGKNLCYSSYLGGENSGRQYAERCLGMAYAQNTFYLAGYSSGNKITPSDFPVTPGAFQTTPSGSFNTDGVVASIDISVTRKSNFSATQQAICTGTAIDFHRSLSLPCSAYPNDPASFTWYFPGGTPATSNSSSPFGIAYNAPGNYDVTLVINTPCGKDSIVKAGYIQVTDVQVATVTANPSAVCPGDSSRLSVSGITGSIQWQSSTDSVVFTDIDSAVNYTYTTPALLSPTYYRVAITGGCSDNFSAAKLINVSSLSAEAGLPSATPDSVCTGGDSQLKTNGSVGNIRWQSSLDGGVFTDITGVDSARYFARSLAQTTYFRVIAGTGGCSDTSATVKVTVNALPATPEISFAEPTICSGDSSQVCAPAGYQYEWNTGARTACIQAKSAGGYWVTVTNPNGCSSSSQHITLTFYPVPSISITVKGDTLTSLEAVSYQWYKDNTLIPGANDRMYIATSSGRYNVVITDANGCRTQSTSVNVVNTGITELAEGEVSVYPNPFTNKILVQSNNSGIVIKQLMVYDIVGREVLKREVENQPYPVKLDVSNLQAGMYYLVAKTNSADFKQKLLKQ